MEQIQVDCLVSRHKNMRLFFRVFCPPLIKYNYFFHIIGPLPEPVFEQTVAKKQASLLVL